MYRQRADDEKQPYPHFPEPKQQMQVAAEFSVRIRFHAAWTRPAAIGAA